MDIGTGLAGGGITGAIMAALYVAYKCCYRKKFHSKCCGAEMDVQADTAAPSDAEVVAVAEAIMSRQATPVVGPAKAPSDPPPLEV
jgi:hypothetical protein